MLDLNQQSVQATTTINPASLAWIELNKSQKDKFIKPLYMKANDVTTPDVIVELKKYIEQHFEDLYMQKDEIFYEDSVNQLFEEYGIKAKPCFSFHYEKSDGFCFDNVKSIDLFKFFTKINLLNVNEKLNDATTPIFKEFIDGYIDVEFKRINNHYDHENSVTVNVNVYQNFFEDDDEDNEIVTERVFDEPEFVQWLKETYTEFVVEETLREWNHDYCLERFSAFKEIIEDGIWLSENVLNEYDEAIACFLAENNDEYVFDVSNPDVVEMIKK